MREIKFRAWDAGREIMWYKDTKTQDDTEIKFVFYASGIGWGVYDNHFENRLVTGDPNAIFHTPGVLMQYTGLKDKNGKEIYEGDIVKKSEGLPMHRPEQKPRTQIVGSVKKVIFHEGGFQLTKSNGSPKYRLTSVVIRYYGLEIIGNIYENPELMISDKNPERIVETDA